MSEEQREWIIPLPYPECDAAFYSFLLTAKKGGITFQRSFRIATAGSCSYILSINLTGSDSPLGSIRFRQVGGHTLVHVFPPSKHPDLSKILNAILVAFWKWFGEDKDRLNKLPLISQAPSEQSDLGAAIRSAPAEITEPKLGDSIDAWLDWREREQIATGRRISLTYIAREGQFKIDTLKKRSAARQRQKAEELDGDEE